MCDRGLLLGIERRTFHLGYLARGYDVAETAESA
jgi:hypothetical protein